MAENWLSFEKPIVELEKKINELKGLPGIEDELNKLQQQTNKLIRKIFSNLTPWQMVQLARHQMRPYTLDLLKLILDDFVELHGDRRFGDDPAIVAGIGKIENYSVAFTGHQKGRDTKEKIKRNFGMPHPEGYRKAMRIMRLAEKFKLPVINFIDTPGAYPGVGAEERGQAEAIANNIMEMSLLQTPLIVFIIGEGGSGGALAIAVGDRIYMLEYAIYSVISPEGCASILWRDSSKAPQAAEALKLTSKDLLEMKIIDEIIKEPLGGAHRDWEGTAKSIKEKILRDIPQLQKLPTDKLVQLRIEKFKKMGVYKEVKIESE